MKDTRVSDILKHVSSDIDHITSCDASYLNASNNCENIIGSVEVPLGVAGPLEMVYNDTKKSYVIPLATTERWLVASINRGIKACNASGGIFATSDYRGVSRAPVFETSSLQRSLELKRWIQSNIKDFQKITKTTSRYLEYKDLQVKCVGNLVFMRCMFDAKDAMGMNMATFAAEKIAHHVAKENQVNYLCVSSNFCSDKKQTALNFIQERGFSVHASVTLSESVIADILKTDVDTLIKIYQAKIQTGSMLASTYGQNAHIANSIGSLFLATGQDVSHVVEASNGVTTVAKQDDTSIEVSVYLPSILCGITGGGTLLPKQKQALTMMGLEVDTQNIGLVNRVFAALIGSVALAGEISLMSSLSEKSLASTHRFSR